MHNIGNTVGGSNQEFEYGHEFENEFGHEFETGEFEEEFETGEFESGEFEDEFLHELHGESGEIHGYEFEEEYGHEVSNEALEMEMASELLEVSNEQELEQFLGGLISKAAGAIKGFAKSSAGRALGGFLKSAAKKALPIAGSALGNMIVPGLGGAIGGKLGSLASGMFELELEGLSNEDKEFELARAYVRFANNAVKKAATNPNYKFQPRRVARAATISAARRFAPGLLRRAHPSKGGQGHTKHHRGGHAGAHRRGGAYPGYAGANYNDNGYDTDGMEPQAQTASGTWYQQGNQIILNL